MAAEKAGGRPKKRRASAAIEAGKSGRFEIGRAAVGRLDQRFDVRRCLCRQAEAPMDRGEEPQLDRLVVAADHRLERRDHVADHVFGRVVQQHGEAAADGRAAARAAAPAPRPAGNVARRKRCARPWSGRSSAPRAPARARCLRSRCRAARDRADRAGAPTACAARRAAPDRRSRRPPGALRRVSHDRATRAFGTLRGDGR